jgi:mannosyltransferase OCH1-like enzyme
LLNIVVPGQSKRDAIAAYIGGRGIKFIGNALRPLFYLHYWLFPNQRFTLKSSVDKQGGQANTYAIADSEAIPKIVWQTNYTNKVTLPIKAGWLCNRLLSQGYDYKFYTTEMRRDFVEEHFPREISQLYNRLTIGAAQADLWRLLVLYRHGGIYIDIDAHLVWPLDRIIPAGTSALFFAIQRRGSHKLLHCKRTKKSNHPVDHQRSFRSHQAQQKQ